jgi:hypothetical protein
MRKWAIILAVVALVSAGGFVAGVSWWTRSTLYAGEVTRYCIGPKRMEHFRNGGQDTREALAVLIIVGDQRGALSRVQRLELSVVRRFGFFFLSHDEQVSFITQLPACAPTKRGVS